MGKDNCVHPGCEETESGCQEIEEVKGNIQEIVGFFNKIFFSVHETYRGE